MIKIENIDVYGWETAIRGMRNPMNSWDKSDTVYGTYWGEIDGHKCFDDDGFTIGENDLELMKQLSKAGTEHRKYMRMINVTFDCYAPLYWWKEFDTYKIGTVSNSCSTMHKIHSKEFELNDFSHEHLDDDSLGVLEYVIANLNECRKLYVHGDQCDFYEIKPKCKDYWWQMIQLLPSSYNQRRTVQLNYEVAVNIIRQRKNHKLDEWHCMVKVLMDLPYMKEIMGCE